MVIGDTGCRIKTADDAYQACNDPKQYPFARVARAAAAFRPDLVLHVGDFLYRERLPGGKCGLRRLALGLRLGRLAGGLFRPRREAAGRRPLDSVRGNHENCDRAGQGWWRFLDPRPLSAHRDCNAAEDDPIGDASPPYGVPLGGGVQVVVLDLANTGNARLEPGDPRIAQYEATWTDLVALARNPGTNWIALHHPLLAFAAEQKDGRINLLPGNQGIISVFSPHSPTLLPANVSLVLSGHVHVWQQVSFSSPHPSQFVAGFSGTQEDIVPLPPKLAEDASPAPGAVVAHYASWVDGFGFMTMEADRPRPLARGHPRRRGPGEGTAAGWSASGPGARLSGPQGGRLRAQARSWRAMKALAISWARSVCGPGVATHSWTQPSKTVKSHLPPAAR